MAPARHTAAKLTAARSATSVALQLLVYCCGLALLTLPQPRCAAAASSTSPAADDGGTTRSALDDIVLDGVRRACPALSASPLSASARALLVTAGKKATPRLRGHRRETGVLTNHVDPHFAADANRGQHGSGVTRRPPSSSHSGMQPQNKSSDYAAADYLPTVTNAHRDDYVPQLNMQHRDDIAVEDVMVWNTISSTVALFFVRGEVTAAGGSRNADEGSDSGSMLSRRDEALTALLEPNEVLRRYFKHGEVLRARANNGILLDEVTIGSKASRGGKPVAQIMPNYQHFPKEYSGWDGHSIVTITPCGDMALPRCVYLCEDTLTCGDDDHTSSTEDNHVITSQHRAVGVTSRRVSSNGGKSSVWLFFHNHLNEPIEVFWVDGEGIEDPRLSIYTHDRVQSMQTYTGHVFRVRLKSNDAPLMVKSFKVDKDNMTVHVLPCAVPAAYEFVMPQRLAEIKSLIHHESMPCSPPDKSAEWSCLRKISLDRENMERWGFQSSDNVPHNLIHQTADASYVSHIPEMPVLTKGPGWLKMAMPAPMAQLLSNFWKQKGKVLMKKHEPIGGGYTNEKSVPLDKVDLDRVPGLRQSIIAEMQPILQWWSQSHLVHTSTFGMRVYRRDSMLVTHVDRKDTHLVSAVLQVSQDVDEGWPLEVLTMDGTAFEVYLQPGEMVLYEGGRIRHGRPMRLNGSEFVNIFTHFSPVGWHGPGRSPKFDGPRYLPGYRPVPGQTEDEL